MKILIRNTQRRRSLDKKRIIKTSRGILTLLNQPAAELSILFVGDRKMSALNAAYRGISKSTDVLSFSSELPVKANAADRVLGDIVISVPRVELQAKDYGLGFYDELCRLLIHGVLHLLGHDHERSAYGARKMRKKEQEIFNALTKMD